MEHHDLSRRSLLHAIAAILGTVTLPWGWADIAQAAGRAIYADRTEVLMALRSIGAFVAAFVACVTATHADLGERFELDIRLRIDPSLVSRRITEALKVETETIWAPYGVRLRWTDADASRAGIVSLDAGVVRQFHAHQRVEQPAVLGSVVLGPDAPARRPICISFDATESVLAHRRTTGRLSVAGVVLDRELTRALGRVLAHEIGHVLIGASHDRAGLMRATFDANELAEPDNRPFRLTRSSVDRLESRLRALTGSAQTNPWQDSTPLDLEGFPGLGASSPVLDRHVYPFTPRSERLLSRHE